MLLVGFAALIVLFVFANPRDVISHMAHAAPSWIAVASGLILVSTLLGACNSYVITQARGARSFRGFLRGYWVAWAVGLIVPGQIGDVVTLGVFLRRHGMALPASLGRVGTDKLISLFCSLLVASQLYRLGPQSWLQFAAGVAGILAAAMLALFYGMRWLPVVRASADRRRFLELIVGALREARALVVEKPQIVAFNVALSLLKIGVTGLSYVAVLRAIVATVPDAASVTIAAIGAGLVAYLPLSANGIGLVEAAGVNAFAPLGLGISAVLAMYVILRFLNLLLAWLPVGLTLIGETWTRQPK